MRHRVAGKKLNRTSSHRKALAKNLMRSLIIEWQGKGHIVTTRSKAKFIQPRVEKLISLSRTKCVHNIRRAMSLIGDRKLVQLLFDEIGPYYKERPGGYTRLLRLVKPRLGDASVRAYLGYVREDDEYPEGDRRHQGAAVAAATDPSIVADSVEESQEPEASDTEVSADDEAQAVADENDQEPSEAPQSSEEEAQAAAPESAADEEQTAEETDPVPEAESGDLVVIENLDTEQEDGSDPAAEEASEESESAEKSTEDPEPADGSVKETDK
ncbi:MAG: 50S ribosomal protein L17 [Planctomycetota bacterium]|nr:50S ribosomal protein L17 [Planctomycetota bacterium]